MTNDGKIALLEQLKANAQLARTRKKTDAVTAQFASELEAEFDRRIAELSHVEQPQPVKEAA